MTYAEFVHVNMRAQAREVACCSSVVEMNMRHQRVTDIRKLQAMRIKTRGQMFQRAGRPGFNQHRHVLRRRSDDQIRRDPAGNAKVMKIEFVDHSLCGKQALKVES